MIQEFPTGAIRDSGKGKIDFTECLSFLALQRYGEYMLSKKKTYGEGNWKKGIPITSYEQSLLRHIHKYFANKYDGAMLEPNEDHLAAAFFNLQGLIHEEEKAELQHLQEMEQQYEAEQKYRYEQEMRELQDTPKDTLPF